MADLPSVPLVQPQPFDMNQPLSAISNLIGIKQKQQALATGAIDQQRSQQALDTGAIEQQRAQANTSMDQGKAKALQDAQTYLSNGVKTKELIKPDGSFDYEKGASGLAALTGAYAPDIAPHMLDAANTAVSNKKAVQDLGADRAKQLGTTMTSVAALDHPTERDVLRAFDVARQLNPNDQDYQNMINHNLMNFYSGGKDEASIKRTALQLAQATNAPNADAALPGQAANATNQIINRSKNSGALSAAPIAGGKPGASGSASSINPTSSTVAANTATATDSVKGANSHVEAVRAADENYGNNKAISAAIRNLASNAKTGPGTDTWNHVMGVLGTEKANNYQELGAFLDRQAATVRGQMGLPGTNQGAEEAKMIAGNTGYNAPVIKDKNDYTEALTEGLHAYRNGLDRVAGFSGQADPAQVNKYRAQWAQNFDPNVYKGELAYKRSKAEGDAFMSTLKPNEAASIAAKRKALQQLSSGQLQ
jgi:hypothetical protein